MIFKQIPSYPDFLSSDTGVIKAKATTTIRSNGRVLTKAERIINQHAHPKGYMQVRLCRNGIGPTKKVHKLVAEAHIPNPNNYREVNHKNGNKADNRADNLEWCSRSWNIKHSFLTNLRTSKGDNNSNSKLTTEGVNNIRKRSMLGESRKSIHLSYPNVAYTTIVAVINGKTWQI